MKRYKRLFRRTVALLTILTLIFTSAYAGGTVSTAAWNGTVASSFAGGYGTAYSPYLISTPEQLAYFAQLVNSNNSIYNSSYYELAGDIDLGGREWTPIGHGVLAIDLTASANYAFKGVFNGNGHTVSNFKITKADTSYLGLFGNLYGGNSASIANLHVSDFTISVTKSGPYNLAAGGLVGTNYGIISSCGTSNGSIDVKTTGSNNATCYTGGLVGRNQGGAITKSYSRADVSSLTSGTSCHSYAGGLVGYITTGNITNCYSIGNVSSTSEGATSAAYAGGFAGGNGGSITSSYANSVASSLSKNSTAIAAGFVAHNFSSITNSYATGNVTTVSSTKSGYGGGFVGLLESPGTIASCFATGNVNVSGGTNEYVGGFAGKYNSGTLTKSYRLSSQTVSGTSIDTSATVTTDANLSNRNFFTSITNFSPIWNFTEVWTIGVSGSYQYPTLILVPHPTTWGGDTATSFSGGNGSASAPYEIATKDELAYLANTVNDGNTYQGTYFKLTSNIDLGGLEWIPIGRGRLTAGEPNASTAFCGNFDGGNYTISNFNITTANTAYTGLFGIVYGGSVSNLKVTDFNINVTTPSGCITTVGGIAGTNTGTITGCYVSGNVTGSGSQTAAYVGGLVGRNEGGQINESIADVQVNAVTTVGSCHAFAGGLVGYNESGAVNASYSTGEVTAHTAGTGSAAYSGGLTAMNYDNATIADSYSNSNVSSVSNQSTAIAGGFIGHNYGSATNCYSTGNVNCNSVTKSGHGGGFVGNAAGTIKSCFTVSNVTLSATLNKNVGNFAGSSTATLTNCYYTSAQTVSPTPSTTYGNATSASNLKKQVFFTSTNNFATPWNMTTIWTIGKVSGYDYPTLINTVADAEPQEPIPPEDNDPNIDPEGWDGTVAEEFEGGRGTEAAPYEIATPGQLLLLANKVNDGNSDYTDKHYILTDNINLNHRAWTPIGKGSQNGATVANVNTFSGTFDGNGYTIENLKINRAPNGFAGLFGSVYNGELKNILLNNVKLEFTHSSSSYLYAGAVAGYINGTLTDSYSGGIITITNSNSSSQTNIGGLIGYSASGEINGSTSEMAINITSSSSANVGGIIGYSDITLIQNAAKSDISANSSSTIHVGGIVGYIEDGTATDCYSSGKISGESTDDDVYTGGLAGYNKCNWITSYASGDISAASDAGDSYAGGLFGYSQTALAACFAVNNVTATSTSGNSTVGGLIGKYNGGALNNCYRSTSQDLDADSVNSRGATATLDNLKSESFLTNTAYFISPWDFENVWQFKTVTGYEYPIHRDAVSAGGTSLDVWEGQVATGFDSGSGTSARPYKIANAAQLAYLAYMVNTGTDYDGVSFVLTADIDLSESPWVPIGKSVTISDGIPKSNKAFSGNFDGKGYTIRNMSITIDDKSCYGLFGCINGGSVSNLNVEDYTIEYTSPATSNIYAGGIAGIVSGNITDCYTDGKIIVLNAKKSIYAGGIAGVNHTGIISSTRALGSVKVSTKSEGQAVAGGIVGVNREGIIEVSYSGSRITPKAESDSGEVFGGGIAGISDGGEIMDCYNVGEIRSTANWDSTAYAGGIVGMAENNNVISVGYSTGDISSTSSAADSYAGGIVGAAKNSTVESALSIGDITAEHGGGIVGQSIDSTITKCYKNNQQTVTASDVNTEGTSLSADYFKDSSFLTDTRRFAVTWDFDSIWTSGAESDYEYPTLQSVAHITTDDGGNITPPEGDTSYTVTYDDEAITITSEEAVSNVVIIISAYNGNVMTNTEILTENLTAGENLFFTNTFTTTGADRIKIMLWDSAETQSQLTTATEIEL